MRILVIDDKAEERERAITAVVAAGHEAISAEYVEEALKTIGEGVDGILTDMFWAPSNRYGNSTSPSGLLIAIEALHRGIPIVICTDENHHGDQLGWIYHGYMTAGEWRNQNQIAIGWEDRADDNGQKKWGKAMEQLIYKIEKGGYWQL